MLLTPRTFHRAGGFASWLHLCCCGQTIVVGGAASGGATLWGLRASDGNLRWGVTHGVSVSGVAKLSTGAFAVASLGSDALRDTSIVSASTGATTAADDGSFNVAAGLAGVVYDDRRRYDATLTANLSIPTPSTGIAADSNGNIYATRNDGSNPILTKYDSAGSVVWTYTFSPTPPVGESLVSVAGTSPAVAPDGSAVYIRAFYITQDTGGPFPVNTTFHEIHRINSSGAQVWSVTPTLTTVSVIHSLSVNIDGNLLVAGGRVSSKSLTVLQASDGAEIGSYDTGSNTSLACDDADGNVYIVGGRSGSVSVWSLDSSLSPRWTYDTGANTVGCAARFVLA